MLGMITDHYGIRQDCENVEAGFHVVTKLQFELAVAWG
jgi:hypothetical protein